jgi:hypothetical protein
MPKRSKERQVAARVIITVRGGVAEALVKPVGLELSIYDYDVEGEDADRLDRDADGQLCSIGRWETDESLIGNEHWPIVASAARKISTARRRRQRWQCPNCQRVAQSSAASLAEAGTPFCSNCDRHMDML